MVWVFSDIEADRIIRLKCLYVGEQSYKRCRTRETELTSTLASIEESTLSGAL